MNSLFGQSKSLILLMYFNRVQLYVWTKKSLELAGEFGKEPEDRFNDFLALYPDHPVIIVTDYLEESFRHDTGVHVSGPDRSALLERKLNYSFRNTAYRAASIVGRDSDGRKDDKILLSALTKPEMLEPWVKVLLDNKVQIQTVTSVAYLMQDYSQKSGLNDMFMMIVSIDEGSELRQTFLRNGKIQFSRLTSLTTKETASLPDAINHESLQIRQYLERIKLLPFDSQMVIRVFSPFRIDELSLEAHNNELNVFECFNTQDLADSFALSIDGLEKSPTTLFLARILQKARLRNVYAPLPARKYFQLKNLASGLAMTGVLLVGLTVLLKTGGLFAALGNWDRVDTLQTQTAPLDREYGILTQSFPDTPIPSQEMALVVETTEHINKNAYFFSNALSMISRALQVAPELQITNINWQLEVNEPEQNEEEFSMFGAPSPAAQGGESIQSATLADQTRLGIIIEGLAYSPQSYRAAQNQVTFFQTALDDIPGVTITSSRLPTDVRVDATVSTLVDNNALRAPFTIELTVTPQEQAQAQGQTQGQER